MMGGSATELDFAHERNLTQRHVGGLCMQIDDELTQGRGQRAKLVGYRAYGGHQATHASVVKGISLPIDGPLVGTGCMRALGGQFAKDDDRPDQLVDDLLGPFEAALEFCPVLRPLVHDTLALRHGTVHRLRMRHA
jgi:hypothetical protein